MVLKWALGTAPHTPVFTARRGATAPLMRSWGGSGGRGVGVGVGGGGLGVGIQFRPPTPNSMAELPHLL